jgi:hypothetical protein
MTDRPVPVTVHARTAVPVDETFVTAVEIDLTLIFRGLGPLPAVVGTRDQTGPWDRVGVSRRPELSDGSTAFEEITAYRRPEYFEYEVSRFTNGLRLLVTGARGDWTFSPTPDGGTAIAWTYTFRALPFRRIAVRLLVAPVWRRYMRRALAATVGEVDRRHRERAGEQKRTIRHVRRC